MTLTQVGIDIGGTFTDIVVSSNSNIRKIKVLSTPSDYSEGVITALSECIKKLNISAENISEMGSPHAESSFSIAIRLALMWETATRARARP